MSAQEPELDVPEVEEIDTPFKRRLAVVVAVLALFGGTVGFAAGEAGAQEDSTGAGTPRASVLEMSGYSTTAVEFYEMLENSLDAASLENRGQIAHVRAALLGITGQGRTSRQWGTVAREVSGSSVLSPQAAYSGDSGRLLTDLSVAPDQAFLRQQAESQASAQWAGRRRLEIGIVTLAAVALTLLGLSLTVGEGIRKFLIWPAGVIAGLCAVGFGWVLSQPVVVTPDAAIKAVAAGDRMDQLRDFSGAVASYTRAIDLQPGYATALADRATAGIVAASPQRNSISFVVTTSTTAAYRSAISDYLQALANGGDQYPIDVDLGAAYFHVRDYADTAGYSQQAIALNPGPPLPWLNLAIALLAEGKTAQALRTYHHAIGRGTSGPGRARRVVLVVADRAGDPGQAAAHRAGQGPCGRGRAGCGGKRAADAQGWAGRPGHCVGIPSDGDRTAAAHRLHLPGHSNGRTAHGDRLYAPARDVRLDPAHRADLFPGQRPAALRLGVSEPVRPLLPDAWHLSCRPLRRLAPADDRHGSLAAPRRIPAALRQRRRWDAGCAGRAAGRSPWPVPSRSRPRAGSASCASRSRRCPRRTCTLTSQLWSERCSPG